MIQLMQTLLTEHGRIRRMLSCFENQLDSFAQADTPDYEILEGSIAYCQEYLDRWHHPREDALLHLLQRLAPKAAQTCVKLEVQHLKLARQARELVKVFEAVERGAELLREDLVDQGRTLLSDYRRHILWEETNFFPAITDNLQPRVWRQVELRFADATDPLAHDPIDHHYRALFSTIWPDLPVTSPPMPILDSTRL